MVSYHIKIGGGEHFDIRRFVQKELIRTLQSQKIVNDEIIFVRSKVAKAEHSKPM